jgi:diguanylate cyclase (GGDEF)-like protein/PAS domain S-box-containing protein
MTLQQRMAEIAHLNNELEQDKQIIDANLMIVKTDCDCMIIDVTEAFHHFTGYTKEELMGYALSSFHAIDKSDTDFLQMKEILLEKKKWSGEVEIRQKNDAIVWMDTVISPYLDDYGDVISYTAIYHDITDKKRIELLSVTDPLTKLFNRQKFNEVFELLLLRRHWKDGRSFGFIIADIDYFKKVNDTYGHQAGDMVLVSVAQIFAQTIRPGDVLARWGGEEFVFLIPDVDVEKLRYVAEKLRMAIEKIDISKIGHVTASFGMSIYGEGDTQESLLHRADTALYLAKENGRNRVELLLA